MAGNVRFDRINLILEGALKRTIPNATWQGPLLKLNDRVLRPIVLGLVPVAPGVKKEASAVQRKLIEKLLTLPKEKPSTTPKVTRQSETSPRILFRVICGGGEGEVSFGHKIAGLSVKGGRTGDNEDSLLIGQVGRDGKTLIVVADGMGGHNDGKKASAIAVRTAEEVFRTGNINDLSEVYNTAQQALITAKMKGEIHDNAGTTMVSALIDPSRGVLRAGNVGDSRAYLIRNGRLYMITSEDSLPFANLLGKHGGQLSFPLNPEISEKYYEESYRAKENRILRAMGLGKNQNPFEVEIPLQEGDIVLLTSDGVHDYLPLNTLKELIRKFADKSALQIAQMITEAVGKLSKDNITVAVYIHLGKRETEVPKPMERKEPPPPQAPEPSRAQVVTTPKAPATPVSGPSQVGAKNEITSAVNELLANYQTLAEKLNQFKSQRDLLLRDITKLNEFLTTLRRIIENLRAQYLVEIERIKKEYQDALNKPEIKQLAMIIEEESSNTPVSEKAREIFAHLTASIEREYDAKIKEAERKMNEKLAPLERNEKVTTEELTKLNLHLRQINEIISKIEEQLASTKKQLEGLVENIRSLLYTLK